MTVFAKLVSMFFKSVHALFFLLTRSLIYRCQIVTDTCKNNVLKFVWKPFKSPLSLRKWKSHLFYLPFTRSNIVHFMEDLAVFTALNHSVSFEKNFVKFKKNIYDIYRLRYGPYYEKLWHRSWKFSDQVTVFHHFSPRIIFESLNIVLPALITILSSLIPFR